MLPPNLPLVSFIPRDWMCLPKPAQGYCVSTFQALVPDQTVHAGAGKMALSVKPSAARPDALSSIPDPTWWKEQTGSTEAPACIRI